MFIISSKTLKFYTLNKWKFSATVHEELQLRLNTYGAASLDSSFDHHDAMNTV